MDDVRSQNVIIPARKSRLDFYRDDMLGTIDKGLQESFSRRQKAPDKRPGYEPLPSLPAGAQIVGVHRSKMSRRKAIVLRDA